MSLSAPTGGAAPLRLRLRMPRLPARLRRALDTRAGLADLAAMDDAMLRDIGLARGDIHAAVRLGIDPRR